MSVVRVVVDVEIDILVGAARRSYINIRAL